MYTTSISVVVPITADPFSCDKVCLHASSVDSPTKPQVPGFAPAPQPAVAHVECGDSVADQDTAKIFLPAIGGCVYSVFNTVVGVTKICANIVRNQHWEGECVRGEERGEGRGRRGET